MYSVLFYVYAFKSLFIQLGKYTPPCPPIKAAGLEPGNTLSESRCR